MTRIGKMKTSKRTQALTVLIISLISVTYFIAVVLAADGDLDATFGSDGTVSAGATRTFFGANSGASLDDVNAIGVLSTGKNIAGGLTHVGGGDGRRR